MIYPIVTARRERATIVDATPTTNRDMRIVAVHGVSPAVGSPVLGYGGAPGGPASVAAHHMGELRPLAGLRFTPANRSPLGRHAWVAVTVKVLRGHGCLDVPPLCLRYRVGGTDFSRVVPATIRLAGVGPDTGGCL